MRTHLGGGLHALEFRAHAFVSPPLPKVVQTLL